MFHYRCVYRDAAGKKHREEHFARSIDQLRGRLRSQGFYPVSIREMQGRNKNGKKMGIKDAQVFAEGLSMLLSSGHTLKDAMPLMRHFSSRKSFQCAVAEIASELEKGKSFHQAVKEGKMRFPEGFANLSAIGEQSGSLSRAMGHLSVYYKRIRKLRSKLGTSMIYPCFVLMAALIAGVFLGVYVQPKIIAMLRDLSPETLENMSNHPLALPVWSVLIMFASSLIMVRILFRKRWKAHSGSWWMKFPLLGKFLIEWNLMNWSFAMELLCSQQLVMDRCLREASHTVSNPFLQTKCRELADAVANGEYLSEALRKESLFPVLLSQWILIGENTGRSEEAFMKLRDYFEDRVSHSIDIATQLVEPFVILLIGIVVIYAVLRFIVPLFQLMGGVI